MQSPLPRGFARCLISALAVMGSAGCGPSSDVLGKDLGNSRPVTREDAYGRQVDLDVAAIVAGMTRAHGAQAVAVLPKWWQDLLSHP
jgi:hypothetical protein